VFYAAWGAAALHPSMAELTQQVAREQPPKSVPRLILIMLASLIAPIVLLVEAVTHQVRDAGVIAVCSALLYVLVLSRLADVAGALRRALTRTQVMRLAGADLAGAATVEQAASAVRSGVASLMGDRQPGPAVLAGRAARRHGTVRRPGGELAVTAGRARATPGAWR
jgi:hypothetical protein